MRRLHAIAATAVALSLLVNAPAGRAAASRDPVLARYREHGFCAVLPKPYGLEQLRKVLDQAAAKPRSVPPA